MPLPDARASEVKAIADRLEKLYERIARTCQRAGRSAKEVTLVGVTKTFPLETIAAAIEAALTDLGENKAQELSAIIAGSRAAEREQAPC